MNLIDSFIDSLEEDTDSVDLKDILSSKDDLNLWEITMLAYVKFLEIMVMKAAMVRGMESDMEMEGEPPKDEPEGNMYG